MSQVSLQHYPINIAAGDVMMLAVSGTRFLLKGTDGALNVALDIGGSMRGVLDGEGYNGREFTGLTITNDTAAAVTGEIVVSTDEAVDHRITGAVTFAPLPENFSNANVTVTNADAQIMAANAARKYLLLQNNGAGDVYVTLDGAAATVANGVRLAAAGGTLELPFVVPVAAVRAIGSIANNPNVVAVEA